MEYGDRDSVGFKEFQALAKARGYDGKWSSASHFFVKSHISNISVEYHFYKNSTKKLAVINYVPPADQTDDDREDFRKIDETFKGTKWKFLTLNEVHTFGARNETLTGARYIDFNDDIDEYFDIADHCQSVPIIGGEREEPIKWKLDEEGKPTLEEIGEILSSYKKTGFLRTKNGGSLIRDIPEQWTEQNSRKDNIVTEFDHKPRIKKHIKNINERDDLSSTESIAKYLRDNVKGWHIPLEDHNRKTQYESGRINLEEDKDVYKKLRIVPV